MKRILIEGEFNKKNLFDLDYRPETIASSETKFNFNTVSNIDTKNYNFHHIDSTSHAGGVGHYLKDTIKYQLRNDLNFT